MGNYKNDSMGVRYDMLGGFDGVIVNIRHFMETTGSSKRNLILKK